MRCTSDRRLRCTYHRCCRCTVAAGEHRRAAPGMSPSTGKKKAGPGICVDETASGLSCATKALAAPWGTGHFEPDSLEDAWATTSRTLVRFAALKRAVFPPGCDLFASIVTGNR